jgi:hypothetical protein
MPAILRCLDLEQGLGGYSQDLSPGAQYSRFNSAVRSLQRIEGQPNTDMDSTGMGNGRRSLGKQCLRLLHRHRTTGVGRSVASVNRLTLLNP